MTATDDILDLRERITLAIRIGESHFREFKSAVQGPPGQKTARPLKDVMHDVGRTLVAFANSDGGELLIGVEDDGTISGLPYSDDSIRGLLDATTTQVHPHTPLPPARKTVLEIDGNKVVYFYVAKGSHFVHLTADGRCLKRIDRESVPVSAEHIQSERLEDASRDYDRTFMQDARLHDLDLDLVQGVAAQVAYGIGPEKCLQYLDLGEFTSDGLRLKNAALLLFAKDIRRWHPRCQVRITSYAEKEKRSGKGFRVLKDDVIYGNIMTLVESAWQRLQVATSQQTTLSDSARFKPSYLYPQIACREALINAIVHRNYAIEGRGIEISIFTDRLEILNPGQLLSTVSMADLTKLQGVHESRNPLIARVLREVGFVREMGEGIKRIFEVMRSNALATPELLSDSSGFRVTLHNMSLYGEDVHLWLSNFESFELTEAHRAVLALGYGGNTFSTQDIIDRLGIVDVDQVREIITPLRSAGILQRTKGHNQAILTARRQRIPKRQVPSFTVVTPDQNAANVNVETSLLEDIPEDDDTPSMLDREIYLGNLPFDATIADVSNLVSSVGDVKNVQMPSRNEGKANRGFAFVTLRTTGSLESALQGLDGIKFRGRHIRAQIPNRLGGQ